MRTLLPLVAAAMLVPAGAAGAQRAPGWIGIGFEVWSEQSGGGAAGTSVVVTEVLEGSPAQAAGIEVGDRLLQINQARTANDFGNLAQRLALRAGDRVDIALLRNGRRMEVSLRAAERPSDFAVLTVKPAPQADPMVETMFRAMDSLRVQILASTGVRVEAAPRAPDAPQPARFIDGVPEPQPVNAPFEFFIFRGQQHDSLRLEMEALNRRIENLQQQERRLEERLQSRRTSRAEARALEAQLVELQQALEAITRESSELREAMAEAALQPMYNLAKRQAAKLLAAG